MKTLRSFARPHLAALLLLAGAWLGVAVPASSAPDAKPHASPTPTAAPTATPSAAPTPAFGVDLGVPQGLAVADTVATCNQGFVTESAVQKCPDAVAHHNLILVWHFENACVSKPCRPPDGFNIVRALDHGSGPATTFGDPAPGNEFGKILTVTAADVVGSCFYVLPFRGTNDYGRKSNTVCIDEVDHFRLAAKRVATTHAYSHDDGTSCKSPSSNPEGYTLMFQNGGANSGNGLNVGFVTRSGGTSVLGVLANPVDTLAQAIAIGEAAANAGNNTCNHYNDEFQGLVYFDLTKVAAALHSSKTIAKARLDVDVVAGGWNGGSASGGDGNEHAGSPAPDCAASVGFPKNVDVGNDYSFPAEVTFDTFASVPHGVGHLSLDLTGMVRAWLHPGGVNRGLVLSPSYLDPTHAPAAKGTTLYNADCLSRFGTPYLSIDLE